MKKKHILATLILLSIHTVFLGSGIAQNYTQWKLPEGAKARLSKGEISGISFSPDGSQIAVGSATGIWLYDARTGAELALFTNYMSETGHMAFDYMSETGLMAFSPDGKTLVNGMYDTILIWDVGDWQTFEIYRKAKGQNKCT